MPNYTRNVLLSVTHSSLGNRILDLYGQTEYLKYRGPLDPQINFQC